MDLSTLVTSNDDSSAWPYFHIHVFDINFLTYRYHRKVLYEVEDCKDDRAAVATKNAVDAKRTRITSNHWAHFRLGLRRSAFIFGDSLDNDLPKTRITGLKKSIARALQSPVDHN
ncbi:hypothetical protein BGZ89_006358, partial [Linnemannia elongata]